MFFVKHPSWSLAHRRCSIVYIHHPLMRGPTVPETEQSDRNAEVEKSQQTQSRDRQVNH